MADEAWAPKGQRVHVLGGDAVHLLGWGVGGAVWGVRVCDVCGSESGVQGVSNWE